MDLIASTQCKSFWHCDSNVQHAVLVVTANLWPDHAGYVNIGAAFIFGMVGSAVSAGVMVLMEKWGSRYIDDTLDVFACHGVGGTTGTILFSLLSTKTVNDAGVDGAYYGKWSELGVTLLVLVCVIAYVLAVTWAILWFTNKLIRLRVSGELRS